MKLDTCEEHLRKFAFQVYNDFSRPQVLIGTLIRAMKAKHLQKYLLRHQVLGTYRGTYRSTYKDTCGIN